MTSNEPAPDRNDAAPARDRLRAARRFIGWVALCYWGALFVATHAPLPPLMPATQAGSDKVVHVVAFAGLGFLTTLWLALWGKVSIGRLLILLSVLVVYGAFDEWTQQFVHRMTDFDDWVADICGASIGVAVVWSLQAVRPLQDGTRPLAE